MAHFSDCFGWVFLNHMVAVNNNKKLFFVISDGGFEFLVLFQFFSQQWTNIKHMFSMADADNIIYKTVYTNCTCTSVCTITCTICT